MNRFEGRTILVTGAGAGSGIGAACMRRPHAEGAAVVAGDVRQAEVEQQVAELGGGGRLAAVGVDVTQREQVAAFVAAAAKLPGTLYGAVNCAGIRGVANRLPYAASKYAVSGITQTMALELGAHGIRANAIASGMIRMLFVAAMFQDPENVKRIAADHPIGRYGEPKEIASVVAFLLSDDASVMTGAVIPVDGGKSAGAPTR